MAKSRRIAVIEKEKCFPSRCGDKLCMRVCPVNRKGEECIVDDPADKKVAINVELCIGCNICVMKCPFGAIHIENLPGELDSEPIHLYRKNGFHLYNLPTPVFGKVTGIIGRNGIGKSTAIKILANVLKPNLGNLEKEAAYEELIDFFKGSETQGFFEKLRDNKINVSYKPQNVDMIPRKVKGTVKKLLKKVDEKEQFEKVVELLDLKNILSNDITAISGGELQRVAIAATVLKKANLYIFDEPTSYLDIKQRLRVAQFIRGLADDDTSVIVIEHDLIALDYMTDVVHVMYGKPGVFGIVSLPIPTKGAINTYLEGYLKEENVRFRDKAIKFEIRPPSKAVQREKLTSWTALKKKLNGFSLDITEGLVNRHERLGVLGENGIGKTTFMKIVAGVLKPDQGKVEENIRVSYKPQYLDNSSDELVEVVLRDAVEKYNNEIIEPMEITPLLQNSINTLSGGELQRVAIALALSKECDVILLDEPSAYLDIEQRLVLSKIIKNIADKRGISVIVIDHDLLFLDYLSERLLVFDGEPAKHGTAKGPFSMEQGMNSLLKEIQITLRREEASGRPRINKPGSQLDQQQKRNGKYYYV